MSIQFIVDFMAKLTDKWKAFKYQLSNAGYTENIIAITAQLKDTKFQSLLELGCYPGHSTEYYLNNLKIKKYFAVDYKEELLGRARAMGVEASICDLEKDKLPFNDNSFNLVIANQVFEHLKNIFSPLSEIHRVLKPGGILVFSVPNLAVRTGKLI